MASAASLAVASTAMVAFGATPSSALATCPSGHICFYHDYVYLGNGRYTAGGTMSDQTATLLKQATTFQGHWGPRAIYTLPTYGKISNMNNSHYTNGEILNDSISLVVNNSNECLVMWPDINFSVDKSALNAFENIHQIEFGPHASKALAGATLGSENDRFSSVATIPGGNEYCHAPAGGYVDQGGWTW